MPTRIVLSMIAVLLLAVALSAPAVAAKRVALVIGNAVYTHAPQLANPLNDAGDIGAALGRLGFEVTKLENAGKVTMERGLLHFSRAASTAETAVVFYAGHGIEVDKRNFLVPVDARLLSDREVEFETVPLDLVGRAVEGASGLGLVILDACRDNPFAASMRRAGSNRSIGRGLARVEPSGEMLVAYAAKEGTLASDGTGRNSPYTRALLAHLEEPGLEVGLMFRKVRDAVLGATGNKQEPFVYGSLSSKGAYLGARPQPPKPQAKQSAPPKGGGTLGQAAEAYKAAERLNTAAAFEAVARRFPGTVYADLARGHIRKLRGGSAPANPPSPAKPAPPVDPAAAGPASGVRPSASHDSKTPPEPGTRQPALTPEAAEAALGLRRDHRRLVQSGLKLLGFDPGPVDGIFGERSRAAIAKWQSARDKAATGYLDAETAKILSRKGNEAPPLDAQRKASKEAGIEILTEALGVAGAIENQFNRTLRLSDIGKILAKSGDHDRAAQIISLAVTALPQFEDEAERTETFTAIAEVQAAADDRAGAAQSLQNALTAVRRIEGKFMQAWMLTYIAEVQAATGDESGTVQSIRSVLATIQPIKHQYQRARLLMRISETQTAVGDKAGAAQSLQNALTAVRQVGVFLGARAHAELARAQAAAGDISNALETMGQIAAVSQFMPSEFLRVWALTGIAEAQTIADDGPGSVQSIRSALATTSSLEPGKDKAQALALIAAAQTSAGDKTGAAQSIQDALALVQQIDDKDTRPFTLHLIAKAQALAGATGDALTTARRIEDTTLRARTLTSVAETILGLKD